MSATQSNESSAEQPSPAPERVDQKILAGINEVCSRKFQRARLINRLHRRSPDVGHLNLSGYPEAAMKLHPDDEDRWHVKIEHTSGGQLSDYDDVRILRESYVVEHQPEDDTYTLERTVACRQVEPPSHFDGEPRLYPGTFPESGVLMLRGRATRQESMLLLEMFDRSWIPVFKSV